MTLAQIVEKPMTVTIDETINSFADNRQARLAAPARRPNGIRSLPISLDAPETLLSA